MSIFGPEAALLIVDMVNDFVSKDGIMYVSGAESIIPEIRQMADEARKLQSPVIYICDSQEMAETESGMWSHQTEKKSPGTEIVAKLSPAPSDYVVRKHQYSSPFSRDLDMLLRELGIAKLVLTGTAVDVCIYFIARDAYMKGYKIIVPRKGVVALSEGDKEFSLDQMEELFEAEIINNHQPETGN